MASFTLKPLQQTQLHLTSLSPSLANFKVYLSYDSPTTLKLQVNAHSETSLSGDNVNTAPNVGKSVILKDRHAKPGLNSKRRTQVVPGVSSMRFKDVLRVSEDNSNRVMKCENNGMPVKQNRKERIKKSKIDSPGGILRVGFDMCSKRGDVVGAIKLYDLAKEEGFKMGQSHYAILLYLCSSAATGMVQPAKSGSRSRSLSSGDPFPENSFVGSESLIDISKNGYEKIDGEGDLQNVINNSMENYPQSLDALVQYLKKNAASPYSKDVGAKNYGIQVSKDVKRVALRKGFEIYNEMRLEKVEMNEATFTSVARMAMALGDGDMAFDIVKQMKEYGASPRLRSYGPALAIFCSNGDVENAFKVEKHMLENGVYPEEPELEALLKVSIQAGKSDKVYYVLHKLRRTVRQVLPTTADVIERWFMSKAASRVGKRKCDRESIIEAMQNGGGGWHGKGWLGKGKWTVCRSPVGSDGLCKCCGKKLVTVDLDPAETETFAKSVVSIAAQRERNSSFQQFQKWLDYYGPFEAVVDAANVGLYSQRKFKPSKVNAVVNGIRQMLPSRKWPLIILHNRRISGEKMDEPFNRALIDKWKTADALYATPTGSNDDWYWLYAAIKYRCLIVTNDEMRDHLFQLLGNDFFPKWKERHQVHFSFTETGPTFRMPPPCSVVIQESEEGHWHIPIALEFENEEERIWLCCSRAATQHSESQYFHHNKTETRIGAVEAQYNKQELSSNSTNHASVFTQLEAAEKLGACGIDFQI